MLGLEHQIKLVELWVNQDVPILSSEKIVVMMHVLFNHLGLDGLIRECLGSASGEKAAIKFRRENPFGGFL